MARRSSSDNDNNFCYDYVGYLSYIAAHRARGGRGGRRSWSGVGSSGTISVGGVGSSRRSLGGAAGSGSRSVGAVGSANINVEHGFLSGSRSVAGAAGSGNIAVVGVSGAESNIFVTSADDGGAGPGGSSGGSTGPGGGGGGGGGRSQIEIITSSKGTVRKSKSSNNGGVIDANQGRSRMFTASSERISVNPKEFRSRVGLSKWGVWSQDNENENKDSILGTNKPLSIDGTESSGPSVSSKTNNKLLRKLKAKDAAAASEVEADNRPSSTPTIMGFHFRLAQPPNRAFKLGKDSTSYFNDKLEQLEREQMGDRFLASKRGDPGNNDASGPGDPGQGDDDPEQGTPSQGAFGLEQGIPSKGAFDPEQGILSQDASSQGASSRATLDPDVTSRGAPAQAGGEGGSRGDLSDVEDDINFLRYSFYFDEELEDFLPRTRDNQELYYFDLKFGIWRLKRPIFRWAGDYYFDDRDGQFYLKDSYCGHPEYYYCNETNVWRLRGVEGPSSNGARPYDYYFDESFGTWVRKLEEKSCEIEWYEGGKRWIRRHRCSCGTADDWYFHAEEDNKAFKLKEKGQDYFWMAEWEVWRPKSGGAAAAGVTEDSLKQNSPQQQQQLQPLEIHQYYYDEDLCQMLKQTGVSSGYALDTNNRVYRKNKILIGRSNPKNWSWSESSSKWEYKPQKQGLFGLMSSVRDYETPWTQYYGPYSEYWLRMLVQECPRFDESSSEEDTHWKEPPCARANKPERRRLEPRQMDADDGLPPRVHRKIRIRKVFPICKKKSEDLCPPLDDTAISTDLDAKYKYNQRVLKIINLSKDTTDDELKSLFESVCHIERSSDAKTAWKTDFAYITFSDKYAAMNAYKNRDNIFINGRKIKLLFKRVHS